jgi:hypothetical protein
MDAFTILVAAASIILNREGAKDAKSREESSWKDSFLKGPLAQLGVALRSPLEACRDKLCGSITVLCLFAA